jgi:hypothetical protein
VPTVEFTFHSATVRNVSDYRTVEFAKPNLGLKKKHKHENIDLHEIGGTDHLIRGLP